MGKIKIGVIGAGSMGKNHIRIYREMSNMVDLVGFYDIDYTRCSEIQDQFHIPMYERLGDLLEKVDGVSVASPTPLHYEHGLLCLQSKVHALIEKPLADSATRGCDLETKFLEKKLILHAGFVERFNPAILTLREILKNSRILCIDFQRMGTDRRLLDTTVVHDLMVHDLDLLDFLALSEFTLLSAKGAKIVSSVFDYATALGVTKSGAVVTFTASRVSPVKRRTILVQTEHSIIKADCLDKTIVTKVGGSLTDIQVPKYEPLKAEISTFINAIMHTGSDIGIGSTTGVKALSLADAVCKYAEEGDELCPLVFPIF